MPYGVGSGDSCCGSSDEGGDCCHEELFAEIGEEPPPGDPELDALFADEFAEDRDRASGGSGMCGDDNDTRPSSGAPLSGDALVEVVLALSPACDNSSHRLDVRFVGIGSSDVRMLVRRCGAGGMEVVGSLWCLGSTVTGASSAR